MQSFRRAKKSVWVLVLAQLVWACAKEGGALSTVEALRGVVTGHNDEAGRVNAASEPPDVGPLSFPSPESFRPDATAVATKPVVAPTVAEPTVAEPTKSPTTPPVGEVPVIIPEPAREPMAAMGADGATVAIPGATFHVPPGAAPEGTVISIAALPADISAVANLVSADHRAWLEKEVRIVRAFEIGPTGTTFGTAASVTVAIEPASLPAGKGLSDLGVAIISGERIEDVRYRVIEGGITVEVPHCSALLIGVAVGAMLLPMAFALTLRGQSEPMLRRDCAAWVDRDNAKIKDVANDPARFAVDTNAGTIRADVGAPMKGKDVGQGNHALRPGRFIDKPEGDCVNFSSLYGSMLSAKGYPVRLVSGSAVYPGYSGLHQWAETVIDGKAYYVDTFNPGDTRLVPIEEANKRFKLGRTRMCGRDADGKAVGPSAYNAHWFRGLITDDDAMIARYHQLRAEHRGLHEACIGGNNGACNERRAVYLEAMEMRRKLEAKGIKVLEKQ